MIEVLESRINPSPFVGITLSGGNLTVEGGSTGENVTVSETSPGVLHFDGNGVTLFSTGPNSTNVPSLDVAVTGSVTIELGNVGNNIFTFTGADIPKNLVITEVGSGSINKIHLDTATVGGSVTLNLGGSSNMITGTGNALQIGGNLSLTLGGGTNSVALSETQIAIGGGFSYKGNAGSDTVSLTSVALTIEKNVSLLPGDGQATIALAPTGGLFVGGNVVAKTGDPASSPNQVTVGSSGALINIAKGVVYNGGPGADTLNVLDASAQISGEVRMSGNVGNKTLFISNQVGSIRGGITNTGGTGDAVLVLVGSASISGSVVEKGGTGGLFFSVIGSMHISGSLTATGAATAPTAGVSFTVDGLTSGMTVGGSITAKVTGYTGLSASYGVEGVKSAAALSLTTGAGNDTLSLDDLQIIGATNINTGAGMDALKVESSSNIGHSIFHGAFTARLGDGNDGATIGSSGTSDQATFGGAFLMDGGTGVNTLGVNGGTVFAKSHKTVNF